MCFPDGRGRHQKLVPQALNSATVTRVLVSLRRVRSYPAAQEKICSKVAHLASSFCQTCCGTAVRSSSNIPFHCSELLRHPGTTLNLQSKLIKKRKLRQHHRQRPSLPLPPLQTR